MAEFIVMPKLGFDMREGVLVTWLKQVGDSIDKGEVVAEIESDKATLELESQVSGTLLHQIESEGAVVPVGANLAVVGAAGEDISDLVDGRDGAAGAPSGESAPPAEAPAAPTAPTPAPTAAPAPVSGEFPGGVRATPVARRLAREKELDLSQISGSGPGGRIRKADVEAFLEAPRPAPAAPPVAAAVPAGPDDEPVALSRLRQAIGRRMAESKTTVPHFYVTTEVDMAAAMALRRKVNEMLPPENKVSVNDLIVKAAAVALRDFPNLNSSFNGDQVLRHRQINVGSAVAVEGGLLTVVQKETDRAPLSQVAADNRAMIQRARSGKVHTDDVTGSTFTVSNLGPWDVDHFIAIVNPPEAAIMAVGSVAEVPVVIDGELRVGRRMKATVSADHRVTDGAEVAQYLQRFKALLEEPLAMLV